jgi:hypothetical protein
MKLPSTASICRWVQNVRVQPGLNSYMIKSLEGKVKNLSVKDKQCILLMDEGLRDCKIRDIVVGYIDDGVERSSFMANSGLVFMVKGLFKRWKQAISFTFTAAGLQASSVKQHVIQVLDALQNIGLQVRAIVSDQGSSFSKMFKDWGVSVAQPFVQVSDCIVFVFPDPPHLLKNMRNMLFHNDVRHADGTAKWSHISQLYE